jgi:hypothetical protein
MTECAYGLYVEWLYRSRASVGDDDDVNSWMPPLIEAYNTNPDLGNDESCNAVLSSLSKSAPESTSSLITGCAAGIRRHFWPCSLEELLVELYMGLDMEVPELIGEDMFVLARPVDGFLEAGA